jgi:DNA replication factor GINS
MYNELTEAWKRELENTELEKLTPDFYACVADYLRRLREEGRMLDRRIVKARLLKREIHNAKRMLRELIQTRYRKIIRRIADNEKIPSDLLTKEEAQICAACTPLLEAYQNFATSLIRGQMSSINVAVGHKNVALRFLKDVPEIIGADMKSYGPFKAEDVASLPPQNAQILTKQELAARVEVT